MDAQRLRALSAVSPGRWRRGRIQRQVHGQPVRPSRRLMRHAGSAHSRELSQLLPGGRALAILGAAPRARRLMAEADLIQAVEHYRELAPRYDHYTRRINAVRDRAIEALELRSGERVIDAGCGTGWCLPRLAERVGPEGEVVGFDPSPEMLAIARTRHAGGRAAPIRLFQAAAQSVALPSPADAILFSYT